ncbi:hypothetical protein INR49_003287, partial [Caranx melampygus]
NQCPEEDASFLSKFFFFWFSRLVFQGYRCPLEAGDLWSLRDQDSSIKIMRTWKSSRLRTVNSCSMAHVNFYLFILHFLHVFYFIYIIFVFCNVVVLHLSIPTP